MKGVQIDGEDFYDCLKRYDRAETLFYCDPPYTMDSRSDGGRNRYMYEFNKQEHIRLAEAVNNVKGAVMVSGYPDKLYDELFSGWVCERRETIATAAKGSNSSRVECVWLNPALSAMLARERAEAERDKNVVDFGLFA